MDALTPDPESTNSQLTGNDTPQSTSTDQVVDWFRQASPYIDSHRNKTFVLCISDTLLASEQFTTLIQDIALLKTLGVRLILVYGLRLQIDQNLSANGQISQYNNGLRITSSHHLEAVIGEVGHARIRIESRLSMGLANTSRAGTRVSIASGNFVTAQPYGVIDGVDYQHTGVVREIHRNAIRRQIENDQIVLLSPLGYSRTGELFNLEATDVATQAAIALKAEKLLFICDQKITHKDGTLVRESTPKALAEITHSFQPTELTYRLCNKSIEACNAGVKRVHILSEVDANALLKELFTRDGFGTMINADTYETLRPASIIDVGGIIALIKPLEQDGTLIKRSREQLELDIEHFYVIERDGMIICCAALLYDPPTNDNQQSSSTGEIACLATHPHYRNGGRAETMLAHLEAVAISRCFNSVYVLTTRTNHWFLEHGYRAATVHQIPQERQRNINHARNSKILIKQLILSV